MANVKISDLTAYVDPASSDILPIVDLVNDVTKKVTIADLLENAGDGSAAAPAFAFNSDSNTGIYRSGADELSFATAGTQRLVIDSSGNVSVGGSNVVTVGDTGTVTSTMILDGTIVNADINSAAAIALNKLASGALPSTITIGSSNIVNGTIVDADISTSAAISLSKLSSGALPSNITVTSSNISDLSIVNADVNASAAIAGTKVSPNFGSQNVLTTGNCGIGTTSPVRALQIGTHGSGNGEMALASSTTGNCSILMGDGASGSDFYRGYIQYQNNTDSLVFATATTQRMAIDSSGTFGFTRLW